MILGMMMLPASAVSLRWPFKLILLFVLTTDGFW